MKEIVIKNPSFEEFWAGVEQARKLKGEKKKKEDAEYKCFMANKHDAHNKFLLKQGSRRKSKKLHKDFYREV